MLHDILSRRVFNNEVSTWLICLAIFAAGALVISIARFIATRCLKERVRANPTPMGEFIIERIRKTGIPLAYLAVVQAALSMPELPLRATRAIHIAGIILMAIFLIQFAVALVRFVLKEYVIKEGENTSRERALKAISSLLNAVVWIVGVLFILDNLGFEISTVMAGLGIGGIAVALAAQTILGDMFAYFTILIDRPFEIGDYIVVGDFMGTVERFGIKTTRIMGMGGEQIIMSNKDLTDSRVRNFKRMTRRRATFNLGVTYETRLELLREIPVIITNIFREFDGVALDRVHFASFGDFSLVYEIVYFVKSGNFNKYMDFQQAINFRIAEEFLKIGVEFAYPTQTLHLRRQEPQ